MTPHVVSSKTLLKSTFVATVIALIALVCIILPAEYNIDPTHIGQTLGLTALANPIDDAMPKVDSSDKPIREPEVIEIIVPAGKGMEYKFQMAQYAKMTYEWRSDGEPLYFDLHGEPQGDTTGYFESYAIATLNEMKGSFTSPFEGSHGWYWKNNSNKPVAIQLTVEGQYEVIGLK